MKTTPIDLDPAHRSFPAFSLTRLLGTVFAPTEGCRICILTDFPNPRRK
jgi:aminopeptidase